MQDWNVLIKDNREGYIDWGAFEENLRMVGENAHMQRRAARDDAHVGAGLCIGVGGVGVRLTAASRPRRSCASSAGTGPTANWQSR